MKYGVYCNGSCYYRPNCLYHSITSIAKNVVMIARFKLGR